MICNHFFHPCTHRLTKCTVPILIAFQSTPPLEPPEMQLIQLLPWQPDRYRYYYYYSQLIFTNNYKGMMAHWYVCLSICFTVLSLPPTQFISLPPPLKLSPSTTTPLSLSHTSRLLTYPSQQLLWHSPLVAVLLSECPNSDPQCPSLQPHTVSTQHGGLPW